MEHITTKDAVDYVSSGNENLAATVTTHHLSINRNDLLTGGIRPHFYCLPVVKRETHRLALVEAVVSGSPKFFLGTDSAPHHTNDKVQTQSLKPGIFSSPYSIELYATIFEEENALENLEQFSSINGPQFYGLDINKEILTLAKTSMEVSEFIKEGNIRIKNFSIDKKINWKVL